VLEHVPTWLAFAVAAIVIGVLLLVAVSDMVQRRRKERNGQPENEHGS
jgi:hypothetical protein